MDKMDKVEYIVIHHTGAEEKDAAQVKRYHLGLGWRDIGYHYIIEKDGKIVKGRTGTGAHCTADGMNKKGIGIALIGNFDKRLPTKKQLASLDTIVFQEAQVYKIPYTKIIGHNEVKGAATACPGKNLKMYQVRNNYVNYVDAIEKREQQQTEEKAVNLYRVQVGAYKEKGNALQMVKKLKAAGYPAFIKVPGQS